MLFAGLQLVTPAQSPVVSLPEPATGGNLPLFGREPSGLDASEIDADAEELNAHEGSVHAVSMHAPVVEAVHAAAPDEPAVNEEASCEWVGAFVSSKNESPAEDDLVAAATSSGDMSVVQTADDFSRAAALERAALAGRRAAAAALAEARQQLHRMYEQQQQLCEAEDFNAADALNASIAESEAAVAAAESMLLAVERGREAAALAVLSASAAELAAWDEAASRLTGPQARERKREALELERAHAEARRASASAKTASLAAERDALVAALAAAEQQLAAAQMEEAAAQDTLGSVEQAFAALEQGAASGAALEVPPDVAARLQAAVDNRRQAHGARERAMTSLRALAAAEDEAAARLAGSKQLEKTHARDVAQALASRGSVQQLIKSTRDSVARAAAEAATATEQKAVAVASKNFKLAAELSNTIRELSAEQEAAEASLRALAVRLTEADSSLLALQAQVAARAADEQACCRALALARWRRLREEAQTPGLLDDDERCSLRAEAEALAAEHGFQTADA